MKIHTIYNCENFTSCQNRKFVKLNRTFFFSKSTMQQYLKYIIFKLLKADAVQQKP